MIMERRYGQWAGNPNGMEEDHQRCIKEVWPITTNAGWHPYQCLRRRGYGESGLYCKQHAKKHQNNKRNYIKKREGETMNNNKGEA